MRLKVKFAALLCILILVCIAGRPRQNSGLWNFLMKRIRREYIVNEAAINTLPNGGRDQIVFYNRVGKCGSRSLMRVISFLSRKNKYKILNSKITNDEMPHPKDRFSLLATLAGYMPPLVFNRHVYFLDFKSLGMRPPHYINMIRDPIDRFSSHYNYLKYGDSSGKIKSGPRDDLVDINACVMQELEPCNSDIMHYMTNYLCGQECQMKHKSGSVELAKKHIDEDYLVIGLTEEFETTLLLLEAMLPGYFKGAIDAWETKLNERRKLFVTVRKDVLTDEAKEKLRNTLLKDEYEVYFHAKKKFEKLKTKYLIKNT